MENTEKQIKKLVSDFLVQLGIDFTDVEVEEHEENNYRVNVVSEEPSLMIGHHGENLLAMQKILTAMCHKQAGETVVLLFDVDNYRKRQEENVLTIAAQKIKEVQTSKIQSALPPMSPYFRRLVHLYIKENGLDDVTTESIGEGNYRQVVIKPTHGA
jgi:spoIIIJ-associated protein